MDENERKISPKSKSTNPAKQQRQPLLVKYQDRLFDITEFAPRHPGGEKLLRAVAGGEVDAQLGGEQHVLGQRHQHSKAAYEILARYSLDRQFKKDPLVDGQEPVLWRVGDLGERYWTWIHQPYDGAIRLFHSGVLEQLTRTKWWMIPVFWLPVVLGFLINGLQLLSTDFGPTIGPLFGLLLFAVGVLAWTLVEYSLHRCVFHWHPDPKSRGQITLHFLLHGLHHKTPMDKERLVFPPAAALLIVAIFYGLYRALLPYNIFCAASPVASCSATFYTICRIIIFTMGSRGRPVDGTFEKSTTTHHFKDSEAGFGISTTLWDHVFGTLGVGPL